MKSILIGKESDQITLSLDDEAIQKLIDVLQDFQKSKLETSFSIEAINGEADVMFVPFDVQDKRIQDFFSTKEEFETMDKLNSE